MNSVSIVIFFLVLVFFVILIFVFEQLGHLKLVGIVLFPFIFEVFFALFLLICFDGMVFKFICEATYVELLWINHHTLWWLLIGGLLSLKSKSSEWLLLRRACVFHVVVTVHLLICIEINVHVKFHVLVS